MLFKNNNGKQVAPQFSSFFLEVNSVPLIANSVVLREPADVYFCFIMGNNRWEA